MDQWICRGDLIGDGGCGKTQYNLAVMRSTTPKTPRENRVPRRKIDEAFLEKRLGLCEEWIERWEQGGKCIEESLAPAALPPFIRATLSPGKVNDVEGHLNRLVAAGCCRPVLYFCLEELSPESEAIRAGRRRRSVPGEGDEFSLAAERTEERPYATREDMEAVRNKAEKVRGLIRDHQRELLLVADTGEVPLPSGMMTAPEDADDALSLLKESLAWVSTLAEAYSAPFKKTLLKSKGLLYLTAYVLKHADAKKIHGQAQAGVDNALARLASMASGKRWSPSDLRQKLSKFEKDHERLYKLLVRKLDELHRFHAAR